jgi:hypothetical protein
VAAVVRLVYTAVEAPYTGDEVMENKSSERSESSNMVMACTANGEIEAHTMKSALEAAGIPVELRMEAAQALFAVTVDGLGAVKVLVPEECLEEAKEILENPASPLESEPDEDADE